MARKFQPIPTIYSERVDTAAFQPVSGVQFSNMDLYKPIKLGTGDGEMQLCAAGDVIEGILISNADLGAGARYGGAWIGGYVATGRFMAVNTAAGALAIGDYVAAGTVPAVGTKVAGDAVDGSERVPVQKAAAGASSARVISLMGGNGGQNKTVICEFLKHGLKTVA